MVDPDNIDESLEMIRQAAREYYARKKSEWKPKRDLDAELEEDARRLGYDPSSMIAYRGVMMTPYRSHLADRSRMEIRGIWYDLDVSKKVKELSDKFIAMDFSIIEKRMREVLDSKHEILAAQYDYEPQRPALGDGKNPFAEHTIRAPRKRDFSQKSQQGMLYSKGRSRKIK